MLEQRVYRRNPETAEELETVIVEEWDGIDQDTINHCINYMINLISAIIEADGNYVESHRGYRH